MLCVGLRGGVGACLYSVDILSETLFLWGGGGWGRYEILLAYVAATAGGDWAAVSAIQLRLKSL